MAIPQGTALKDKKKQFNIQSRIELGFGPHDEDFGALLDHPVEIEGTTYPLTGWLGSNGKSEPVVAQFTPTPEKSQSGEHEKPAIRVFAQVDGALREIGVAFRREGKESGKVFFSGKLGSRDLTYWPVLAKEA